MNILAFDTSNEYCSVALVVRGETVLREALAGQGHSGILLSMVEELLASCGLAPSGLGGIAFGAGPGSFTGLRIACGVAQGLAAGLDIPVIGVSTLLAMAQSCDADRVVSCLDARMGEIYHAAYVRESGRLVEVSAPGLYLPGDAPGLDGSGWTGCGSGFAFSDLVLRYGDALVSIHPEIRPSAAAIAGIAKPEFEAGGGLDPALALPVYVRNRVALKESER